jgi:hypothetical protein
LYHFPLETHTVVTTFGPLAGPATQLQHLIDRSCETMSLSSDEITFLEQQIELLKSCSVQEALQMATKRLQMLQSNLLSVSFDPKVRACHRVAVE